MSRKAVILWVALAIAASAVLVWRDVLWDWKRQFDASREFAALVGDTVQYEACFAKAFKGAGCERWQIKAQPNPEYWPYPDKPPFVWPEAPKQQVYKPGMSRVEYFEALCKAEAGEFIYKTVKAEGIYMIRPRMEETEDRMRDRYGIEDPYGYGQGDVWNRWAPSMLVGPHERSRLSAPNYRFVETPQIPNNVPEVARRYRHQSLFVSPAGGERFRVFTRPTPAGQDDLRAQNIQALSSGVGFVWRGIRRPFDREMGIAGGEVVVVDLQTNELLGLRRGFQFAQNLTNSGIWWLTGATCPRYSLTDQLGKIRNRDKDADYLNLFLAKVAVPTEVIVD